MLHIHGFGFCRLTLRLALTVSVVSFSINVINTKWYFCLAADQLALGWLKPVPGTGSVGFPLRLFALVNTFLKSVFSLLIVSISNMSADCFLYRFLLYCSVSLFRNVESGKWWCCLYNKWLSFGVLGTCVSARHGRCSGDGKGPHVCACQGEGLWG